MFFIPLVLRGIVYLLGGLDYLRRASLPPVPPTSGVAAPYTPPFSGGQCEADYNFGGEWAIQTIGAGIRVAFPFNFAGTGGKPINGIAAGAIYQQGASYFFPYTVNFGGVSTTYTSSAGSENDGQSQPVIGSTPSATNFVISRRDGLSDNCGNLPNPTPPPSISSDGLASSTPPNIEGSSIRVIEGSPLAIIPNFGAALTAALNAARNAADALSGIAALANAIDALKDLLEALKDTLDDEDEEKKKDAYRYDFGSIREDGFLRFYPDDNSREYKAELLDIQVLSIPIYYGKYFGRNSPNFYRFKSLGYIAFVSPTFGVMEYQEIEFGRMTMEVPENSVGFFYHLGLESDVIANVSAFYTAKKEETPPS